MKIFKNDWQELLEGEMKKDYYLKLNEYAKEEYISTSSPLAASKGFFGSKPFSKTNDFLESIGKEPIDWQIEDI